MIDKITYEKIKAVSFIVGIMVIYVHSYNIRLYNDTIFFPIDYASIFNIYTQEFISGTLTRIASPIFFIISGFLLFKEDNFSKSIYLRKVKNRFYTLFIPYFFWSFTYIAIYFILQNSPFISQFFKGNIFKDYTFLELMYHIFIDVFNYPLWFIRDLMYMVLISPLFYLFIKYLHKPTLFILLILWFARINDTNNFEFFKSKSMLFFAFGIYLAIHNRDILNKKIPKSIAYLILLVYLSILLLKTYFITFDIKFDVAISLMHNLSIILGIVLFWNLLNFINKTPFLKLSRYSFIFYVFHEPMLFFIKKGSYLLLGQTVHVSFTIYFLAPILVMFILVLFIHIMLKFFPTFYYITTGGR